MIILDFSVLTILERAALDAAARLAHPTDPSITGQQHLEQHVQAMLAASTEAYLAEQLPDLRSLALKYLNKDAATRAEIKRLLDEPAGSSA